MDEIKLTIIDREGESHELVAPTDMNMNVMECYLESDHELPEQSDMELDMLDQAFFVEDNSRLGCQIQITEEMNGLVLRLAPEA